MNLKLDNGNKVQMFSFPDLVVFGFSLLFLVHTPYLDLVSSS